MLGFIVNLEHGKFEVPESRRKKILDQAAMLAESTGPVAVRGVARFVGRIVPCGLVLGPVAVRWARACYRLIEERSAWTSAVTLTEEAKEECRFWKRWFPELKSCDIFPKKVHVHAVGSSDASDFATGGWLRRNYDELEKGEGFNLKLLAEQTRLARELLESEGEELESSTLRELWGIHRSLVALVKDGAFDGETIQWRMDSQAAWFILRRGSGICRSWTRWRSRSGRSACGGGFGSCRCGSRGRRTSSQRLALQERGWERLDALGRGVLKDRRRVGLGPPHG